MAIATMVIGPMTKHQAAVFSGTKMGRTTMASGVKTNSTVEGSRFGSTGTNTLANTGRALKAVMEFITGWTRVFSKAPGLRTK